MSDDTLSYSLGYIGYQVYEEILRKCSNRLVTFLGEFYLLLKKIVLSRYVCCSIKAILV